MMVQRRFNKNISYDGWSAAAGRVLTLLLQRGNGG